MSSFNNKIILITGGASGIGFLMGAEVLKRGAAHLIIFDINHITLEKAANKLVKAGFSVSTEMVDVSDAEQVQEAVHRVLETYGQVDILINNAGIVVGKNFNEHSMSDIKKTMSVNSLGLMYMARALLPTMMKKGNGHIVNIASAAGLTPNPGMTVYAASKWAAVGWSESLKLELERTSKNIKVLTVMPSYINTGMFEGISEPLLIPLLDPAKITNKILNAVEKNKSRLREPFMIKLTPFLKGILPTPVYDFLAGKVFKVYSSMSTFTGRKKSDS